MQLSSFISNNPKRIINGFLLFLLCVVFLLSHSNQSSSQSMASVLLLLGPLLIYSHHSGPIPKELKIFCLCCIGIFMSNLMLFFHTPFSELSTSTMRGLVFYGLGAVVAITVYNRPISKVQLFYLLAAASLLCLYPILMDYIKNQSRGNSSSHPIFWGNMCLTTGLMAFVLSRDSGFSLMRFKVIGLLALCFALAASLWSLTRGGWISIPIALIFLTALKVIRKRELAITFAIVIAAFCVSDSLQNRLLHTINFANGEAKLDASTQQRVDMWKISWEAFKDSPFTGGGLDAFAKKTLEMNETGEINFYHNHAHNEFMDVLASRGILGLLILGSFLVWLFKAFYQYRSSSLGVAGMLCILQYLVYSLSEVFFTTKATVVYFIVIQGILIALVIKSKHQPVEETPCA